MIKTVRPAAKAHSFLLFGFFMFVFFGINEGGAAIVFGIIAGGFFGLLLWFSVKGTRYEFNNGLVTKINWAGPQESIKLADIQKSKINHRALKTGDIILWTPAGKFTILKIANPQQLHDEIMGY